MLQNESSLLNDTSIFSFSTLLLSDLELDYMTKPQQGAHSARQNVLEHRRSKYAIKKLRLSLTHTIRNHLAYFHGIFICKI